MDRRRLSELFEQAVEIPPPALQAWLDARCGDDAELRARLERLLRADASAAAFLEEPPELVAESLAADQAGAHETPIAFGPYRVIRSIGVGGMGEVWLAERSDGEFEQRVAIKQLAYPTPGLLQRFRQERQILARLEHPNIARLIDGGVDANGAPYLVMEYVDGVPIDRHAEREALDVRARLRLFLQICAAVQYAHQNLVVHRDIKPSNLFVTRDGIVKLLDFGVAKVLATTDQAQATRTAARMLTPGYAAPEQFSGGAITTATDVYALGVVLYELLCGVRPPPVRDSAAHDAGTEPPPPSAALRASRKGAAARRRELRGDLDRIVLTALARDPARRYASADALAEDLRRHLAGQPISVRGDAAWYRFGKFARRNRYALAGAVVVVAVCIAAALVSLAQAQRAREQAQRAEAVRGFLVGVFQQAGPDENKGRPISAHELLERGERQITKISQAQPALAADVSALIGELFIDIDDFAEARKLLDRLRNDSDIEKIPADIRARVLVEMSVIEDEEHDFEHAMAHARQSLALLEKAGAERSDAAANVRYNLAHSLNASGDYAEAEAMLRAALPADLPPEGELTEAIAGEWEQLGVALGKLGRSDEAERALQKALAANQVLYGETSQHASNIYNDLGNMREYLGDLSGAEAAFRRAREIGLAALGPEHHDSLVYESNLLSVIEREGHFGNALAERIEIARRMEATASFPPISIANSYMALGKDYRELGRFDEAEAALRKSLAAFEASQGPRALRNGPALRNLGVLLMLEGRYDEAETLLRRALDIQTEHDPPMTPGVNLLRADVGELLRRRHRYAQALDELRRSADGFAHVAKETDSYWPIALAELAEAELDAGQLAAADAAGSDALARARKVLPPGNYQLGAPLFALARVRLAQGRAGDAEPLLREALAVRSPPHPPGDPRVLEVEVGLANALAALGRHDEARRLAEGLARALAASPSPYVDDLRRRLASAH